MKMNALLWIAAIAALGTWFGCHGDHAHSDEHFCTDIVAAPRSVTATSTRSTAPALEIGGAPYDVTLDPAKNTYVKFEIGGAKDVSVNAGTKGILSGRYFEGDAERTLPQAEEIMQCPAVVPEHFDLTLQEVGMYTLELKPSAANVRLILGAHED